jgi:hypothetical protein
MLRYLRRHGDIHLLPGLFLSVDLEVGLTEPQARAALTDLAICGLVTVGEDWDTTVVNLVEAEGPGK